MFHCVLLLIYCFLYQTFTNIHQTDPEFNQIHLDVPLRTVSRGSPGPLESISRRSENVRESRRRPEKVRVSPGSLEESSVTGSRKSRKLDWKQEQVRESSRKSQRKVRNLKRYSCSLCSLGSTTPPDTKETSAGHLEKEQAARNCLQVLCGAIGRVRRQHGYIADTELR